MRKTLVLVLTLLLTLMLPASILAGEATAQPRTSTPLTRLAGNNRAETAIAIADELAKKLGINFASGQQFQNVVLASGNNYPDALAGAPLAGQLKAPILLLDQTPETSATTLNYIKDHVNKTGEVYILGGTGVVSATFLSSLAGIGFTSDRIHRIGGSDRNETSLLIAKQLKSKSSDVVLVSDANFYDALTIASATVTDGIPILLVSAQGLTAAQKEFCDTKSSVTCFGELASQASSIYPRATSFSGKNRYGSNAIWSVAFGSPSKLFLATGENFPDALAGAVLAGFNYSPIILTTPNTLQPETAAALYIIAKASKNPGKDPVTGQSIPAINYPELVVFGGTAAVSENVAKQAQQILNGSGYPVGNTLGNIQNSGDAAVQGDWIYYTEVPVLGAFYKIKVDGTEKTKLSNDSPRYINVMGDWLYYRNNLDRKLYKIKTDGSERTKLTDDSGLYLTLSGNWIYYINESDNYSIWKMSTDGQQRLKLNAQSSSCLNVVGDTIYYVNANDQNKIYKMNSDGSGNMKISDNVIPGFMVVANDTIYYTNYNSTNNYNLYKMRTDGTAQTKIVDDYCAYFNLDGDWIYYTSGKNNNNLYKIKVDGTGQTKLNSSYSTSLNLVNDWIYYYSKERGSVYWIHTDGSGEKPVK